MLAVKINFPNFIQLKGWCLVKFILFVLEDTHLFRIEAGIWGVCHPLLTNILTESHAFPQNVWLDHVDTAPGVKDTGGSLTEGGKATADGALLVAHALGETTVLLMEKIFCYLIGQRKITDYRDTR